MIYDCPELTFAEIKFENNEIPWNFNVFLYPGAVNFNLRDVQKNIIDGRFGNPEFNRLKLVVGLHSEISELISLGHAKATCADYFAKLRSFFSFAESASLPLTLENVESTFLDWADNLYLRSLKISKWKNNNLSPLKQGSAYMYAATVGTLIDRLCERPVSIIRTIRLKNPPKFKSAVSPSSEKQNLENTFIFGHLLQDICDGLSLPVVHSNESFSICPRGGGKINFENYGAGKRLKLLLINTRVEAELLMFVGQTGMNLSQIKSLTLSNFSYTSHLDGYSVKEYKNRRKGDVLFEIFKEYRPHFERYLEWRRMIFSSSKILFPTLNANGSANATRFQGFRIRKICQNLGIAYFSPQSLRNTRVNWLLRQSANPNIVAEMAQHTKQVLIGVYARPSLQTAMVEAARFWPTMDPSIRTESVAPGECNGTPKASSEVPKVAAKPSCEYPSGCLWCEHHRDLDSLDYVWSLATFKYIKAVELNMLGLPVPEIEVSPSMLAIERIAAKLKWFKASNETRRQWVVEAENRIAEGSYHPSFAEKIEELEDI